MRDLFEFKDKRPIHRVNNQATSLAACLRYIWSTSRAAKKQVHVSGTKEGIDVDWKACFDW